MLYQDFDVSIEPSDASATRYRVRVLASPAGQASGEFVLPFSVLELENFFLRVGRPRRGTRYIGSPEMEAVRTFGGKLFDTVFQGRVQSCLFSSLDTVRQQGQGLRLRLHLNDAPALADLPWEYLYDANLNRFFANSTATPLVRHLDLPQPPAPLIVQPPLKVLVMIASPRDRERLDVEQEWRNMQRALGDLEARGLVQLTRLEQATLGALQRQLRRDQYHIFHFIGHGGFDRQSDSGVLLLEDENNLSRLVSGHHLGALLHDHFALRLALLNSCEGARNSRRDPFAGVAQHLVQQGIPAVIAMQFEITDAAAITLAHEFYAALADNYGVDAALAEARKALFASGNDIEWGTPVLYLRARDGQLFDLTTLPAPPRPAVIEQPAAQPFTPASETQKSVTNLEPAQPRDLTKTPAAQSSPPPTITQGKGETERAASQQPVATGPVVRDEERKPKASQLISRLPDQPQRGGLRWGRIIIGLIVVVLFVFVSLSGYGSWQDNQRHAQATATKAAIFAAATAMAPQAQATATVLAAQAKATMQSAAPVLLPLVERYGMHFVYVPAGEFTMGSPEGTGESDEHPPSQVSMPAFWIGQTEVTNAQYRPFVEAGGYQQDQWWTKTGLEWRNTNKVTKPYYWDNTTWNQDNYPVVGVSWYEVYAYTQWLVDATKLPIRLPTEAEWERAARGDDGRIYPWGNPWEGSRLNFCDTNCTYDWKDNGTNDGYAQTAPVGSYPQGASPYGALDMAGNVWEWTNSRYLDYPYQNDDAHENAEGDAGRVLRGGSWINNDSNVRVAIRGRFTPGIRFSSVGVRLVVGAE